MIQGRQRKKKVTKKQQQAVVAKMADQSLKAVTVIRDMQQTIDGQRTMLETAREIIEGAKDNEILDSEDWRTAVEDWETAYDGA